MNKRFTTLIFAFFVLLSFTATAAELKIGYVQVDKILKEAPQTKASGKMLEKEFKPRTQTLDALAKKIKTKQDALQKNALTISESDRKSQERTIQDLTTEFKRKQRDLQTDFNKRKNDALGKLQEKVNKAVKLVAEKEGYDLIMYGGVAYASAKVDMTDKVLKSLNAQP